MGGGSSLTAVLNVALYLTKKLGRISQHPLTNSWPQFCEGNLVLLETCGSEGSVCACKSMAERSVTVPGATVFLE